MVGLWKNTKEYYIIKKIKTEKYTHFLKKYLF